MITRQVTDRFGTQHKVTDDEGRMLWAAHDAYGTYQPAAGQLDVADRLIELGLLERYQGFASLVTTNDGYWVALAWLAEVEGADERRRDYLDQRQAYRARTR